MRDFVVAEDNGKIVGCGALHLYGMHLAEIRSIAVTPSTKGLGAGRKLVEALLQEAERHAVTCVCLFTRIPEFFALFGFRVATREDMPDKIYKDCVNCPRLHACDEVAMVRSPRCAALQHFLPEQTVTTSKTGVTPAGSAGAGGGATSRRRQGSHKTARTE